MGYQAWLGYYNSNLKRIGWNKISLVENANLFGKDVLNLQTPPGLQKRTIGKMGLKGNQAYALHRMCRNHLVAENDKVRKWR